MEMTRFDSLGALNTPAVMCAHDDGTSSRRTHCKKSAEHLPLLETYDAYKSSHMLTMLSMHPSPTSTSMLADAPLPRGSDATLASGVHCPRVPEQFVTWPLCLVGYVRWDERSAPFSRPDIHFRSLRSQRNMFHVLALALPPRSNVAPSTESIPAPTVNSAKQATPSINGRA
jgi:hypothetical protein